MSQGHGRFCRPRESMKGVKGIPSSWCITDFVKVELPSGGLGMLCFRCWGGYRQNSVFHYCFAFHVTEVF